MVLSVSDKVELFARYLVGSSFFPLDLVCFFEDPRKSSFSSFGSLPFIRFSSTNASLLESSRYEQKRIWSHLNQSIRKCLTSSRSLLNDGNDICGTVFHSRPFYVRCSEGPSGDLDDKQMLENLAQADEITLEARLQAAIDSENYVAAAQLRDQLRVVQEDSKAGLRAANAKFYKAFELSDLKGMRDVWARGENVHCIHPGAGRISGYDMVIASWELMLSPDVSLPLKIELHNLEVQVKGNIGYVTCLEVVRTSGSNWGKQLATNIFEKRNGTWFLCMHHASHITI